MVEERAASDFRRGSILERTGLVDRPVATAALGALCIASSGVLVRAADTAPVTVAIYRCLYALPFLGLIAASEARRYGRLDDRARSLAWLAGVFFAIDLIFWHHAIAAVGAGLATVLGNLQVVLVAFAAWAWLGERPRNALFIAIPVVLVGVVLISGVIGQGAYGDDPFGGVVFGIATSLAYAAFLLIFREGSRDLRRLAGPLFHATLASCVVAAAYGAISGDVVWNPGAESHAWLGALALTSQVAGWLLIGRSLPRLPAAVTSIVLLLQPVGAMILAALTFDEQPSFAQLAGAALILVAVMVAARSRRSPTQAPASA